MKSPLTPAGIDPVTFRFVAQHLNHCATAVPPTETNKLRNVPSWWLCSANKQSESLARGPKLLSMYTVEQRGFVFRKYWQTGSFKACRTAFRTEFGERRAPSKCCIKKVKKLETRGSRSNACRLLSLGPIEGQSVQKYTPHNGTTQRCYMPRDSSRQRRHFGKSIPQFGETHSSVLGCERRPVSASITNRSCFASFPVCVYKFSSHYLNNIIFIDNSFGH